jgi:hypothetical protein
LYIDVGGEPVITHTTGPLNYTIYIPHFDADGVEVQGSVGNTTGLVPGVGANLNFATYSFGPTDAVGAAGVNMTYYFEVLAAPNAPPQPTIFMTAAGLAEVSAGAGGAGTILDVSGPGVSISLTETFSVYNLPMVVSIDKALYG